MSDNKYSIGAIGYSFITVAILILVMFPIPSRFLDFLMSLNLIFSFLLMLDVYFSKNSDVFYSFPKTLLLFIVFNLAINIMVTRQILTLGEYFDSQLIGFFSNPLINAGQEFYTAGLTIFAISVAVYFYAVKKLLNRISNATMRYNDDNMHKMKSIIEADYKNGIINDEEASRRKNNIQDEASYYIEYNDKGRILSNYEKLRLVFIIANIIGGYYAGTKLRMEMESDAMQVYVSLAVGSGILSLIPAIFLSAATAIVVKRFVAQE